MFSQAASAASAVPAQWGAAASERCPQAGTRRPKRTSSRRAERDDNRATTSSGSVSELPIIRELELSDSLKL